jgi:hypothetical protein
MGSQLSINTDYPPMFFTTQFPILAWPLSKNGNRRSSHLNPSVASPVNKP